MHSVTDGRTDDVMMPIADHTVYDRLKTIARTRSIGEVS